MKKAALCFVVLFFTGSLWSYFDAYRAMKAYEHGDLAKAQDLFDTMLLQNPDDDTTLYNLGKIAFKQQQFSRAAAHFKKVTIQEHSLLREQAWYDLGLSYVKMEQWQEALDAFEQVLKINPEHEHAKKMIEQIKKMLEEQKKEEEKQQDQQQSEQEKKEDQNSEDDQQDDKNNQNDDKNQENNDNKNSEDSNDEQEKKENDAGKNNEGDEQGKPDEQSQDSQDQQHSEPNQQEQQQENPQDTQQEQRNTEEEHRKEQQAQEKKNNNGAEQQSSQPPQNTQALQEAANDGKQHNVPPDKETMLLQLVEQHDAQTAKKLFKQHIAQHMPSRHGQKNW